MSPRSRRRPNARRRQDPIELPDVPPGDAPAEWRETRVGWRPLLLFAAVLLPWSLALLGQTVVGEVRRWTLFLVPDRVISGWIAGPVSSAGAIDRLLVLGVALLVVVWAAVAGWLLLGGRAEGRRRRWTSAERWSLSIVLGLGLQSTATALVGLAGGLGRWWSAPLMAAGGCLLAVLLRWSWSVLPRGRAFNALASDADAGPDASADGRQTIAAPLAADIGRSTGAWLANGFFVLVAVLLLAHAVLPPSEYDVREYHLQAPKEWWNQGAIIFLPHNIYANMPMGAEMQAVAGMGWWRTLGGSAAQAWWWGALAGKLVLAAFAPLAAILLGGCVRLWVSRWCDVVVAGWSAAWTRLVVLSFPALLEGASLGLVEPALVAFFAAGLFVLFSGVESLRRGAWNCGARLLAATALAAGAALGVKYPAAVMVLPLLAAGWWFGGGSRLRSMLWQPRWLTVLLLSGLAGGGAWYLKNAWLAGNPVYPLLGELLGGKTLTPAKIAQWNAVHQPPSYSLARLAGVLGDVLWRWRLQGWCLLPLAVLGAAGRWRRPAIGWLLASLAYLLGVWFLATHQIARFLLPALPVVALLAGVGLSELRVRLGSRWAGLLVSLGVVLNFGYALSATMGDTRIAVDLQYLRRDDLSRSEVTRLPRHVPWINQQLPVDSRLLVVGDAAVFDYERPLAYSTTFDTSPLVRLTEGPPSQWRRAFAEAGYTHLVMHWGEIARLRGSYGFDERIDRGLIDRMVAAGVLTAPPVVLSDGAVEIYRLQPAERD